MHSVTTIGAATMSSLDIAEITGKNHKDVMRDIREVLGQAEIDERRFALTYKDASNREQPCFNLPRRECDLIVSGYSVKYRLAIIDRWHQLEAKQTFAIPQTLPDALRLAADLAEKNEALALEVSELKPKADFHDAVTASDDVTQLATACQVLGLPFGRNTLFQRLRNRGILISGGDRHNLPKQEHIKVGRFTVKESKFLDDEKQVHVRFTTYVTQKGMEWLMREFKGGSSQGGMATAQ
jgi:anti-repressor protein